jgi:acyl-CoA reductase-like NAD-dependent aldehyde dehydrogenase
MSRLAITKTPKAYVGGAFIRSESGRVFPIHFSESKAFFANIPQCTRKDLRNAVEAAAKAGAGWSARAAYNRGQILYRLGEMIESRSAEMVAALTDTTGTPMNSAREDVAKTIDLIVHFAGWADKYDQVLGNSNTVAAPFFNFTISEPSGVIGIIAPDAPALLGLMAQVLPAIVSGNSVVALASEAAPYPAIVLGEMLATSDLPGGVVNVITGFRKELVDTYATHTHLRGLDASVDQEQAIKLEVGGASSIKRVKIRHPDGGWAESVGLHDIRSFIEFKTVWHPIGL